MCPICMRDKYTQPSGETHYICKKVDNLPREKTGCGTQFTFELDKEVQFPHAIIFAKRSITNFFKYDFLKIKEVTVADE